MTLTVSTPTSEYAVLRHALGAVFTMDARFADHEVTQYDATLLGIFPTLADAGRESIRVQLDDSRRTREDAAAGAGWLNAEILGVIVNPGDEDNTRTYTLSLLTLPRGGGMTLTIGVREMRRLQEESLVAFDLPPGMHVTARVPLTLRRVFDPVKRDAAVARWKIVSARRPRVIDAVALRRSDVLLDEQGARWLIGAVCIDDSTVSAVVTPFTGRLVVRRADPISTVMFAADQPVAIERQPGGF